MHVGAVWIMVIALFATAVLVIALSAAGKKAGEETAEETGGKTGPAPEPDHEEALSPEPRSTA
ncbi:hypothetical protein [Streptomyces sp. NPDC003374]